MCECDAHTNFSEFAKPKKKYYNRINSFWWCRLGFHLNLIKFDVLDLFLSSVNSSIENHLRRLYKNYSIQLLDFRLSPKNYSSRFHFSINFINSCKFQLLQLMLRIFIPGQRQHHMVRILFTLCRYKSNHWVTFSSMWYDLQEMCEKCLKRYNNSNFIIPKKL